MKDPYLDHRQRSLEHRKASRFAQLEPHRERLLALWIDLRRSPPPSAAEFERRLRRFPKPGGLFAKSDLVLAWRQFGRELGWPRPLPAELAPWLRSRPVRTLSGVTPVTILTRPHPCPGRCIFCPSDVRMPKSYLSMEPGAQRATQQHFDPYLQVRARMRGLCNNGHSVDKVELIVLGGTWTHYPLDYRRWFVSRAFAAIADFDPEDDAATQPTALTDSAQDFVDVPEEVHGLGERRYNNVLDRALRARGYQKGRHARESATLEDLWSEHRRGEGSRARCVGLSVETRPDEIDVESLFELRQLGVTKVQMGYQSLDDRILALNQRGHDVEASRRATRLLRRFGFKIQAHWMLNLLGATPDGDRHDFARLFEDPALCPDELKVYPLSLVESSELMRSARTGEWQAYDDASRLQLLAHVLSTTPRYCRLSRVVRDIPSHDVVAGASRGDDRDRAAALLAAEGRTATDLRARQIRRSLQPDEPLRLQSTAIVVLDGEEQFLELLSDQDELVGFLRLFVPAVPAPIEELQGRAVIRELHVYGESVPIGAKQKGASQHLGLGRRLLEAAWKLSNQRGARGLAVISAVGTRAYYRSVGFHDGTLYQHRTDRNPFLLHRHQWVRPARR